MLEDFLAERINTDRLKDFARKSGLNVSGVKNELINRISQAVASRSLDVTDLDSFLAEELSHGRNRMLFVSEMPTQAVEQLKNLQYIRDCLSQSNLPTSNFNNLRVSVNTVNDEINLIYLNISNQGPSVEKISMCFAKKETVEQVDEDGEELPPQDQLNYIWAEIRVNENKIIVKLKPGKGGFGEYTKARELYEDIYWRLGEIFSIPPRSIGDAKNMLYKIFRDLTQKAELPFLEKLKPILVDIQKFVQESANKVGLKDPVGFIDIPKRIERLFQRGLIQEDFKLYQSHYEGKAGVVDRIAFSDQTGAYVNARSGDQDGIGMADIYFDTRDTLDSIKSIDRLWVNWFVPNQEAEPDKWETRLEVFRYYYVVHFLYKYLTKEAENFVLSKISYYESLPD